MSRAPQSLGRCQNDIPSLISLVNESQEKLVKAGGENGWWGTWQKMAFNVTSDAPYVTLPRTVARLTGITVCKTPIRIQNQMFEYLENGVGLQPSTNCVNGNQCQFLETYDRGTFPTFKDLDATGNPKCLRFYPTDQRDIGKRVLVQGKDENGTTLRSLDNGIDILGEYITLRAPFVDCEFNITEITGIQKELTVSDVRMYQVDSVTAEMVLLSLLEPGETVSCYRRYFINGLPQGCCPNSTTIQVTAMAKLDFVPIAVDQDYLLIGNIPALKAACESVRYGEVDNPAAFQMSAAKWNDAIRILNQELVHYLGRTRPAINVSTAADGLRAQGVGTLV